MFVTRASRRDHEEIAEFYRDHDWDENFDLAEGVTFIARQGPIVGTARLLEIEPQILIVEDVVVHRDHRRTGIGTQLMSAAMNSRGGSLYLSTHDDTIPFYERLEFSVRDFDELPEPVRAHFRATGDYPSAPDHVHYFLTAR
jgi:N-acetylglutamate synthase-like GNAT family acetyltransferase